MQGQFFPDVVECSEAMANAGKVVIIAALDGDYRRKPFGRVLELVPMAEKIDKLTAVCMSCFTDAAFTKRTIAATQIELIGGAEAYSPVCRACYLAAVAESSCSATPAATPALATALLDTSCSGMEEETPTACAVPATFTPMKRQPPLVNAGAVPGGSPFTASA
ncbi:hypothetical protein EON66_05245 [archaeon]|nr:MAG: hypothetical protein EON66_05245 [archaeon]